MLKINSDNNSPPIGEKIKKAIENLTHPDKFVLSLQLDYHDHNTLFYLNKVNQITFNQELLEIEQKESVAFFSYEHILEYCVINAEDVLDLEGG